MKISIASGKGGTGKTTLSTNLASLIAEDQEAALIDIDVEEPNSGLFIKSKLVHKEDKFKKIPEWNSETCSLCGNCQEVCNFHSVIKLIDEIIVFPQLCHGCYACSELCPTNSLPMISKKMGELKEFHQDNLTFIESRLVIGEEQAVPLITMTKDYVEEKFRKEYPKIFDAPPGTSCPVIEATKDSDFVILVTEPTPFGLHDLKLSVNMMRELEKKFAVVINRYGIGNDSVVNYCKEENIDLIAKIPNSRKIAELYSAGELLYAKIPEVKTELDKIINFFQTNYKSLWERGLR